MLNIVSLCVFISFQSMPSNTNQSTMDYKTKLNIYSISDSIGAPSIPSIASSNRDLSMRSTSTTNISTTASRVTLESNV